MPTAPPTSNSVTRFVSWNVYFANLPSRSRELARAITLMAPEVISLQETVSIRYQILRDIIEVTGHPWEMTESRAGCDWHFDGVIMYRSDIWEGLSNGIIPYGGGSCYSGDNRALNWVALQRRSDRKGVLVYGTHPVCCRGDYPVMEAMELVTREMASRQQQFPFAVVLMGDMNTGYFEASQSLLRTGSSNSFGRDWNLPVSFEDAYASTHPGDPNPSTIHDEPVRLDYVYFQRWPRNLGQVVGGQVWYNLPGLSDHRAVSGDVIIA